MFIWFEMKVHSDLVGMRLADLVLGERPRHDLVAHSAAVAVKRLGRPLASDVEAVLVGGWAGAVEGPAVDLAPGHGGRAEQRAVAVRGVGRPLATDVEAVVVSCGPGSVERSTVHLAPGHGSRSQVGAVAVVGLCLPLSVAMDCVANHGVDLKALGATV